MPWGAPRSCKIWDINASKWSSAHFSTPFLPSLHQPSLHSKPLTDARLHSVLSPAPTALFPQRFKARRCLRGQTGQSWRAVLLSWNALPKPRLSWVGGVMCKLLRSMLCCCGQSRLSGMLSLAFVEPPGLGAHFRTASMCTS